MLFLLLTIFRWLSSFLKMLRTDLIRKCNKASAAEGSQKPRPTIIGLYGISGSGKSYFMNELKNLPETNGALFFEGSEALDRVVPGGLEAFRGLNRDQKYQYRQQAVRSIRQTCEEQNLMGIVTGHYMLHPYAKTPIQTVGTEADFQTFTHIFYLMVDPEQVLRQRRDDTKQRGGGLQLDHLRKWQEEERKELRSICYQTNVLFIEIPHPVTTHDISRLIRYASNPPKLDVNVVLSNVDQNISSTLPSGAKSVLVLDGDKTLAAADSGRCYAEHIGDSFDETLKLIFDSDDKYGRRAFEQQAIYFSHQTREEFARVCPEVAGTIVLYPQIQSLLEEAEEQPHVAVIVITCGLKAVWEAVLSRSGLHNVLVLGNNRIWDGVFDSETKAMIVKYLQETHSCYVTAFGDSPLDVPMLRAADDAVVVAGDEKTRSKSMDDALLAAMIVGALPRSTRQAVLDSATPRLRAPLPPSAPGATRICAYEY